ncbi:hypothetical protein R3X25_07360 [Lutibacter sp. TH_r2]|uniref:hypothetical protein n=1 Tax=Lutibacter sp. TH_r2 TaxID=3082083 RepID=UPI002953A8FA|nr:hypothetical protein [Lutibacter sp. TH_r2]MDV7187095.1 hypothetical protein [Lutibacter sp. TH_r2]
MKIFFTVLILLLSIHGYSQKKYHFDYVLEYDIIMNEDSIKLEDQYHKQFNKNFKRYYLTNSKNNQYFAAITEKDSLNYKLILIDHSSNIIAKVDFLKSDLNRAEFININCENVKQTINFFNSKKYEIYKLKDTIINKNSFFFYRYGLKKEKKRKKEEEGFDYYIIDKTSDFHLPLLTFSNIFENWSKNKNLPNGFIKESYHINFKGKLRASEKFVTFRKTDKNIILPKNCIKKKIIIK